MSIILHMFPNVIPEQTKESFEKTMAGTFACRRQQSSISSATADGNRVFLYRYRRRRRPKCLPGLLYFDVVAKSRCVVSHSNIAKYSPRRMFAVSNVLRAHRKSQGQTARNAKSRHQCRVLWHKRRSNICQNLRLCSHTEGPLSNGRSAFHCMPSMALAKLEIPQRTEKNSIVFQSTGPHLHMLQSSTLESSLRNRDSTTSL